MIDRQSRLPKSSNALASSLRFIVAGGELADLVRAYDWGSTSLGSLEDWSETLQCAVNLLLSSRFPTVLFWGPDMVQIYNDASVPLVGEKHPRALGQPAPDCCAEAWHIIGPQVELVMKQGESVFQVNVLVPVTREGKLQDVYCTYNYSPVIDSGGNIGGVLTACQDATAVVIAHRERDAIAAKLSQVFETTTDGIFFLDRDWRLTFLNRRAHELLAPSGDVLGTNIWESFPGAVYEGSPYQEHYYRAMLQRQPSEFEAYYPVPLNLWFKVESRPSEDGIIVFFRDITQHKKDQEALRQKQLETERQRAELEAVYDTAPIGLALFDPTEFRYLRMNARQAQIVGRPPDEVIGTRVTDLAPIPGLQELLKRSPLESRSVTSFWRANSRPIQASTVIGP